MYTTLLRQQGWGSLTMVCRSSCFVNVEMDTDQCACNTYLGMDSHYSFTRAHAHTISGALMTLRLVCCSIHLFLSRLCAGQCLGQHGWWPVVTFMQQLH
jgi:hypothetical protein